MRYLALATDFDGTIADHGRVDEAVIEALRQVKASGRNTILVTGRELDDLERVFPMLDLFDRVVAENGALLLRPHTGERIALAEPPPEALLLRLQDAGVSPLSVGRTIVATWEPHQGAVLEAIRALGLEWQVIFNKGAVMALPSGVNKATGLLAALAELDLSPHNVVSVGDAENDHAFLAQSELGVAVANAVEMLRGRADMVTAGDHGQGVLELVAALLDDDLAGWGRGARRHDLVLGTTVGAETLAIPPHGQMVLVAGTSGSGKSTLVTGILERLVEAGRQVLLVDPEGDYEAMDGVVVLGDSRRVPAEAEIEQVLANPAQGLILNLLGLPLLDRPGFFATLLPRLQASQARVGRPHWTIVDEAHHLMPAGWEPADATLAGTSGSMMLVTVHPESVAAAALSRLTLVVGVGEAAPDVLRSVARAGHGQEPVLEAWEPGPGEVLVWSPSDDMPPRRVTVLPGQTERRRHSRKYATGELGEDASFYFTGPDGRLNLRAHNLFLFLQIADGVDDETLIYHLRRGDCSRWLRDVIKDDDLALAVQHLEDDDSIDPAGGRAGLRTAIESRYTVAA